MLLIPSSLGDVIVKVTYGFLILIAWMELTGIRYIVSVLFNC